MLILLLINMYLGFGLSEQTGQCFPNDYGINISAKVNDNRISYTFNRTMYLCTCPKCGHEWKENDQTYSLQSNLVLTKDIGFVALSNVNENSLINLYREDISLGLPLKKGKITNYLTAGISMNKWQHYEPMFREEIIYRKTLPKSDNAIANAILNIVNKFIVSWEYDLRGHFLLSNGRYEYGLESGTSFYFSKTVGWTTSMGYSKYDKDTELHFAKTEAFVSF